MFKLVVQKFGGTSVQDANAMRRVMDIVRSTGVTKKTRPLVVLSAAAGVTNALIRTSELSLKESPSDALAEIDQLEIRHRTIASELIADAKLRDPVIRQLAAIWAELRKLVKGVNLLRELTPKSRDQFQSVGERCSTLIFQAGLAQELRREHIPVHYYDAREFFRTSNEFTAARPIPQEIAKRMKKIQKELSEGAVGITQGFIGSNADGQVTTIGRGGSDFSAAIQGVAIEASEIQIWTDVAGIMTCDPRVAPAAQTVPQVSFNDASQLAFFGAKVLHPETIWPAVENGIPVLVLSSKEPEKAGTTILESVESDAPLTGMAIKRNIVLAKVSSLGALPDSSVQQAVWETMTEYSTVPLAVSLSVDSALYALDDATAITSMRSAFEGRASIEVQDEMTLLSLVGPGLKTSSGIGARLFKALGKANCEMISYGGSDTTVSFVVSNDFADPTVKRLHKEFFE